MEVLSMSTKTALPLILVDVILLSAAAFPESDLKRTVQEIRQRIDQALRTPHGMAGADWDAFVKVLAQSQHNLTTCRALKWLWENDPNPYVRHQCLWAMSHCKDPDLAPLWWRLLKRSHDKDERRLAMQGLLRLKDERLSDYLWQLMEHPKRLEDRWLALGGLRSLQDKRLAAFLIERFDDLQPELTFAALSAIEELADLADPSIRQSLQGWLDSPNSRVRVGVLHLLDKRLARATADIRLLPKLVEMLKDPDYSVRSNAEDIIWIKYLSYHAFHPQRDEVIALLRQEWRRFLSGIHYSASLLNELGKLSAREGNFDDAISLYQEALQVVGAAERSVGEEDLSASIKFGLIRAWQRQGNLQKAREQMLSLQQSYDFKTRLYTDDFDSYFNMHDLQSLLPRLESFLNAPVQLRIESVSIKPPPPLTVGGNDVRVQVVVENLTDDHIELDVTVDALDALVANQRTGIGGPQGGKVIALKLPPRQRISFELRLLSPLLPDKPLVLDGVCLAKVKRAGLEWSGRVPCAALVVSPK